MTDKLTGYGFADYLVEQERHVKHLLDKIDNLVDLETRS